MAHLDPSSDNKLTIKEQLTSSTYVNLAITYANVVAYLYDLANTIIKKWSRETQSGYETLYAPDVYTLEFYIERGDLDDYQAKKVRLEIKTVETVASRGLEDDEEHLLGSQVLIVGESNMGGAS